MSGVDKVVNTVFYAGFSVMGWSYSVLATLRYATKREDATSLFNIVILIVTIIVWTWFYVSMCQLVWKHKIRGGN